MQDFYLLAITNSDNNGEPLKCSFTRLSDAVNCFVRWKFSFPYRDLLRQVDGVSKALVIFPRSVHEENVPSIRNDKEKIKFFHGNRGDMAILSCGVHSIRFDTRGNIWSAHINVSNGVVSAVSPSNDSVRDYSQNSLSEAGV